MTDAVRWAAKAAATALAVAVLVLVRELAGPPYWAELLLTAAVTAAAAWTWSRVDRAAEPPTAADN
ncbi:hypothetical protein ACFXAO_28055 [Streptomyces lavendulae]|uniref:hypothetical protein n=1 Tax=Streptomyces lavendulae TaxID=1914 RepID=UPI0036A19043